ncbi:hypothetical protein B0H67DRAFT_117468 [Lasiosphaeris hirsuta]|uniref:Uncharacterized protein n=1 Tax=Lasiosphaeris hirsuta TaxID=260670 RepID=A0AA40E730_9PEZI|nr:hypothetical protein B0H67DRAFT_117468 [Lasiosphaeris hirsuta]
MSIMIHRAHTSRGLPSRSAVSTRCQAIQVLCVVINRKCCHHHFLRAKTERGQEDTTPRSAELEKWTRERSTQAGSVDYKWSGQIFEPVDYVALTGKNQGCEKVYIVTWRLWSWPNA